ncbi:MAG: M48 family metalloprotease [Bdellovibrio sp.]|nr:M48 family metalloprotease [Methylotenera sp.]
MPHNNCLNQTVITLSLSLALAANTAVAAADLAAQSHATNIENNNDSMVPSVISDAVSDVDMQLRLAAKSNTEVCAADICLQNQAFNTRVQQLGAQLSEAAYAQYPTLKKRAPNFVFSVAEKKEAGSASNARGKVVIFRGLQAFALTDDALSFVMGREMAHVIGKHHNKNTSTKLIISALATILFPAVGIIGASSAATQATTATTLLTSAASTATSLLGSEVALAKMKPSQLVEADEIALKVLNQLSINAALNSSQNSTQWNLRETASVLQLDEAEITANSASKNWLQDLQTSQAYLQQLVNVEDNAVVALETETLQLDVAEADLINQDHVVSSLPVAGNHKLEAAK